MNAQAYREEELYREEGSNVISMKRNPYLMDYEQQRRMQGHGEQRLSRQDQGMGRESRRLPRQGQETRRTLRSMPPQNQEMERELRRMPQTQEMRREPRRMSQQDQEMRREPRRAPQQGQEMGRAPRRMSQQTQEMRREPRRMSQQGQEMGRASRRMPQQGQEMGRVSQRMPQQDQERRREPRRVPQQGQRMHRETQSLIRQDQARNRRAAIEKRRAALRRRRIARMQRMVLLTGILSITLLCGILYWKRMDAKAVEPEQDFHPKVTDTVLPTASSSGLIQGLPAVEFAKHPQWEENFLTPNEYSRPGEILEEVNSIFVHYTANPNTSAAQNRSYFEQLKDTHITSASAHFIIGYNGEIVQCIPLDEIAYAVQTRNYDSVSIECCYKSADGSFTQETYDSLIRLLAWLTDVYDLTTDDILRHYDCGGKKCPIYYTEHEDAWAKLKKDVAEKL